MYGFGDNQAPFTESVDLLEDLVIEYISEMVSCNFESIIRSSYYFQTILFSNDRVWCHACAGPRRNIL
jgi:hypothetical protein